MKLLGACIFVVTSAEAAGPLPPAEELRSFRFADTNLVAELVAAEPDVSSPVALAWDEAHRLYVAEMRDYPAAPTGGTVRRLEDRDGDGRCESVTVFAEGLKFPTSVLPWRGGVLVTAAPDLLFLRDADGDGRAEERRVLFTGFGTGNPQLRANGLIWGLDGWIYGANGRSDGEVRAVEILQGTNWVAVAKLDPAIAESVAPRVSLRGRDFRFQPGTGRLETLAGRSQFGLARDDWGNRFLSWNTVPLRHEVFPDRFLERQPRLAGGNVLADCLPADDAGQVYPLTPAPLVFNNESAAHFNALSGLHIFRGTALGPEHRGSAFVGESLLNLVHRRVPVAEGVTFRAAKREPAGVEFLAAGDAWFHPVNFATGPDGALYVADFYREFVEHPDWVAAEMRGRVDWARGGTHGRVWRIRRGDLPPRSLLAWTNLATAQLVARLESPTGWERDTAQRLLLERADPGAGAALSRLARSGLVPEGRAQALHAASALQLVTGRAVVSAARDRSPRVREQAAKVIGDLLVRAGQSPGYGLTRRELAPDQLTRELRRLSGDRDLRVRLAATLALGESETSLLREPALEMVVQGTTNAWLRLAAASSSRMDRGGWLPAPPPPTPRPIAAPVGVPADRDRVLAEFRPALARSGDARLGAGLVRRLCLGCHYLHGQGQRVGPDLGGLAAKPAETLLMDLLAPNRQVAPDFAVHELTTTDGRSFLGLLVAESAARVTLRFPGSPDTTFVRSEIATLNPTERSLMPDGLEAGLSVQDMADLLTFLRAPDAALLK